jgi:DNA polymerase III sliding clamp (beta) subunit (PCNA family)
VGVLEQAAFSSDLVTITRLESEDPDIQRVAFRCGRHLLIARTHVGIYPNYSQVIPGHAKEIAVIPHDRKPGLIAWLRSLGKSQAAVRLDWHKRGQLTLSHRDANGHSATLQVPVEIHGSPPVITFNAGYLAQALEIGSTLCLSDELSPGICRHPGGRFCVIMPMRVTIAAPSTPDSGEPQVAPTTAQAA